MNFDQPLTLNRIRDELVKIEDAIIFSLIERANFAQNLAIYDAKQLKFEDESYGKFEGSFFDYFMFQMESVHSKVRRYTSPDEYPFTTSISLPPPVLPPLRFPKLLAPNNINLNEKLKTMYLTEIVPRICKPWDDGNHGSAATKDADCLQILSRRIHFGKFVAEAKFQNPETHKDYVDLIIKRDRVGIEALLTNKAVEERLLRRVRKKAMVYGQEIGDDDVLDVRSPQHLRISLDVVVALYENHVIPLTKEVEVEYLLGRLAYPDFKPDIDYK